MCTQCVFKSGATTSRHTAYAWLWFWLWTTGHQRCNKASKCVTLWRCSNNDDISCTYDSYSVKPARINSPVQHNHPVSQLNTIIIILNSNFIVKIVWILCCVWTTSPELSTEQYHTPTEKWMNANEGYKPYKLYKWTKYNQMKERRPLR